MDPQTNLASPFKTQYIIIGVALLILSSAIGTIVGGAVSSRGNGGAQNQAPVTVMQSTSAGNNVVFGSPDEVRTISGTVIAINGNSFTLHTQSSTVTNAFLIDRSVMVIGDTKIIETSEKDPAILSSEMADFNKKMEAAKTKPQLVLSPEPFTHTDANASDITIGDFVAVTSAENISTRKSFVASEIQFHAPVNMPVKK